MSTTDFQEPFDCFFQTTTYFCFSVVGFPCRSFVVRFEQLFEQIVRQCMEVGLVRGDKLSVDGSFVEANAAKESRIPREQLAEAAQVNRTVHEYLVALETQNPVEEPTHSQDKVSTTDPDSTYATKGGTPARM